MHFFVPSFRLAPNFRRRFLLHHCNRTSVHHHHHTPQALVRRQELHLGSPPIDCPRPVANLAEDAGAGISESFVASTPLDCLPDSLLEAVGHFLEAPTIVALSSTSRSLREFVALHPRVWRYVPFVPLGPLTLQRLLVQHPVALAALRRVRTEAAAKGAVFAAVAEFLDCAALFAAAAAATPYDDVDEERAVAVGAQGRAGHGAPARAQPGGGIDGGQLVCIAGAAARMRGIMRGYEAGAREAAARSQHGGPPRHPFHALSSTSGAVHVLGGIAAPRPDGLYPPSPPATHRAMATQPHAATPAAPSPSRPLQQQPQPQQIQPTHFGSLFWRGSSRGGGEGAPPSPLPHSAAADRFAAAALAVQAASSEFVRLYAALARCVQLNAFGCANPAAAVARGRARRALHLRRTLTTGSAGSTSSGSILTTSDGPHARGVGAAVAASSWDGGSVQHAGVAAGSLQWGYPTRGGVGSVANARGVWGRPSAPSQRLRSDGGASTPSTSAIEGPSRPSGGAFNE